MDRRFSFGNSKFLIASLSLSLLACSAESPAADPPSPPTAPTPPAPSAPSAAPLAPRFGGEDPLLTAICTAYDEIARENVPRDLILASTAVRAVERHGVTQDQLALLGGTREAVLASILRRGNPPGCARFVAELRTP